jgi:Alpha-2,8-polysialyltransferase (POLYST)
MVQLFVLSTAYGALTAAAGIDAGVIGDGGDRVLITVNAALVPEVARDFIDEPHLASVRARFDRVERLNDLVAPALPAHWDPRAADLPMLERLLRRVWGIGDGAVELFLQTPQVPPARTLAAVFPDAPITIIGDGLMTYAPIRDRIAHQIAGRVISVTYVDVVPGLEPVLFTEVAAVRAPIPASALRAVFDEIDAAVPIDDEAPADDVPTALVLGQYLAALGILSEDEERAEQKAMIDVARAWGARRVVFKPHPSAPPAVTDDLRAHAEGLGAEFSVYRGALPAEVLATRLDVIGVVAGFSSALPTVQAVSGRRVGAVGNELLLTRLTPFENSNRIPVTIVDALTRDDSPYRAPARLQELVDAVGYAMQPRIAAHLRPRAERFLEEAAPSERTRYFSAERVRRLRLPGETHGRAGGYSHLDQSRLAVSGIRRRVGRAWKVLRGS